MTRVSSFSLSLRRAVAMGVASLLLMVVFSWPLARYARTGIAHTAFNLAPGEPMSMVPGDHLQFLYHLWLAQDTFAGHTPAFHNLYEFNTGDDAGRRDITPYYLPFSAFFAAASIPFGQAAGWNFAGWMSLWLTGLFAWALARRYAPTETAAGLLALIPLAFPYTWVNLLSGSPTGLALMWVPVLLYGLDRWAADASPAGAAWAGAAIFFSEWTDTHVFFFGVLFAPVWILFAWQHRNGWRWPRMAEWRRLVLAAWPLVLFAALAAAKAWAVSRGLKETAVASGRTEGEVALFSVPLRGLWAGADFGKIGTWTAVNVAKIWIGLPALAVYAALVALAAVRLRRPPRARAAVSLALLLAVLAGIALLSTGTENPGGARAWKLLTLLVPPYRMIRQADKIFCLVPTLAMLAVALGASALPPAATPRRRFLRTAAALVAALLVALAWQARHRAGICLLDAEQGAYAAVAADAAARGTAPRAVAIPLWPGDSHLSSLYQHDATLHRIRMLNGYRPTVRKKYREEIFDPLESINLGNPSPAQLDRLAACRIDYLLYHEDAFPGNVSPFPTGATLLNLLSHPRLRFLARDGSVWAFRILDRLDPLASLDSPADTPQTLPILFPSRTWNWKNSLPRDLPPPPGLATVPGPSANSDHWLHATSAMTAPLTSRWVRVTGPYDWQWRYRARGRATLEWTTRDTTGASATTTLALDSPDWTWHTLPAAIPGRPSIPHGEWELTADFRILDGEADMDTVLLTAAPSLSTFPPSANPVHPVNPVENTFPPPPGATATLPAISFYRSGYADPATGTVTFQPEKNPSDDIFEARNFWLAPGPHRITLDYTTPAPAGTPLGTLTLQIGTGPTAAAATVPVLAGAPAELHLDVPDTRYARLSFRYTRAAPVTLETVRFDHLESSP
ncbi:MAG: hypothetical protein IKQ15_10065 [Kiritimatiellae bacterium]|nr:hypothetical protein [Kiritimatiellia bacterium]